MIKFHDLQKINSQYSDELKRIAAEVIDSGWYLQGERVKSFETDLAAYLGTKHAVGVANGLDALRLILRAYIEMGVMREGDEVLVPANTFIASILAITDNGLNPVLVEPDISTYNMSISLIERQITPRTRAIMVVHLYGKICWSNELVAIAKRHNLKIIEDNAQAIGAIWNGKRSGALGDAAGNSFYPAKNLGALGDAGAVSTNDDLLAALVRSLSNYGGREKYVYDHQGFNSRLDEMQAGFLSLKLKRLDSENQRRREIAQYYRDHIKRPDIVMPIDNPCGSFAFNLSHVFHLFVIRTPLRDMLQAYLSKMNIQTLIHYPISPHKQQAYREWKSMRLPTTEQIQAEVLSLPISPTLIEEDLELVCQAVNDW